MNKYYVIRVEKEDVRITEKALFKCLVDRMQLCSLIKLIELTGDNKHRYIILGGQQYSCQRVLAILRKLLTDKGIGVKIYSYDSIKSNGLDNLLWSCMSNQTGTTIKTYYNNPVIVRHIKNLTTKYILQKGLLSNHVFCTECDGFADFEELTSLKGIYKCSFCEAEVVVDGPLITGKKPVNHLSEKEQLYLIGLPMVSSNDILSEDDYKGEQISIPWTGETIEQVAPKSRRRRSNLFIISNAPTLSRHELEQITLDLV